MATQIKKSLTRAEALIQANENQQVIRLHEGGHLIVSKEWETNRQYYHDDTGLKVFFTKEELLPSETLLDIANTFVIKSPAPNLIWVTNKDAANEISESLKNLWPVGKGIVTGPYLTGDFKTSFYEIEH